MSDNATMDQLLAEHNEAFMEAEVFDDWMPPEAEYIVAVTDSKRDMKDDTNSGKKLAWFRLKGQIADENDPTVHGRSFTVGYWTSKAYGIFKGAMQTLKGEPIEGIQEAVEVFDNAVGLILRVKVGSRFSKKHGKDFPEIKILGVLEAEAVDPE